MSADRPNETPEQQQQRESDTLCTLWEVLKLAGAKGDRRRNTEKNRADPSALRALPPPVDNGEPY